MDEMLTRSIKTIYPSKKALEEKLASGDKLRIYMGIDPTADYIHLGHATNYIILKRFHQLGHKIVVLVGDFTAMIGDPSDKTAARKRLTPEDVQHNLQSFKDQIGKILDFETKENPIEFKFNSDWLAKLNFSDLVDLASNFTVQQMIERDVFEKRLKENKPLYVHEFFYPLMQGYDSVALDADLEIGGTDQTFNMLAGRTLMRKIKNKEKFVITTTLLENPETGEKLMSKSLGTGIALNEPAKEMFGKVMSLADSTIVQCFIDCTEVLMEEIEKIKTELKEGKNPRDLKMRLAYEIVKLYHGEVEAKGAQESFINTFQKKEIPDQLEEILVATDSLLVDGLLVGEVVKSKSDFRRLLDEGAITDLDSDTKITDPNFKINKPTRFRVGKKRFVKIVPR